MPNHVCLCTAQTRAEVPLAFDAQLHHSALIAEHLSGRAMPSQPDGKSGSSIKQAFKSAAQLFKRSAASQQQDSAHSTDVTSDVVAPDAQADSCAAAQQAACDLRAADGGQQAVTAKQVAAAAMQTTPVRKAPLRTSAAALASGQPDAAASSLAALQASARTMSPPHNGSTQSGHRQIAALPATAMPVDTNVASDARLSAASGHFRHQPAQRAEHQWISRWAARTAAQQRAAAACQAAVQPHAEPRGALCAPAHRFFKRKLRRQRQVLRMLLLGWSSLLQSNPRLTMQGAAAIATNQVRNLTKSQLLVCPPDIMQVVSRRP